MKDSVIHKQAMGKWFPVLSTVHVKDGEMCSTNLEIMIRTKTELADGLYRLVGGKWLPSPMELDEWPSITEIAGKSLSFALKPLEIKRLLACMSTDETRAVLNGGLLRVHEHGVTMVATDGRRLTTFDVPCIEKRVVKAMWGDYILPSQDGKTNRHPLAMLLRDKKRDIITLTVEKGPGTKKSPGDVMLHLSNGEQTISSKTCAGTYPNFKQVIPAESPGLFYVDRDAMLAALTQAAPYTTDVSVCQLHLGEDALTISASNVAEGLEISVDVPMKHVRRPVMAKESEEKPMEQIALNLEYLLGVFRQEGGVVYIGYTDDLSPVVIGCSLGKVNGKDDIVREDISVLMPMRIN